MSNSISGDAITPGIAYCISHWAIPGNLTQLPFVGPSTFLEASVIKKVADAPTKELVTFPVVIVFEGMMVRDRVGREQEQERQKEETGRAGREQERAESKSGQRARAGREQERAESKSGQRARAGREQERAESKSRQRARAGREQERAESKSKSKR
jgi:hypothetical protein